MLEWAVLFVLTGAAVGWASSVFFYVTKRATPRRWYRVWSKAWLNAVGIQIVTQKLTLISVVAFIWFVRLVGDFPARDWVAFGIYTAIFLEAWFFFINQRRIQKPFEKGS